MKRFLPIILLPALAHASLCGSGGVEAVVPGTGDVTHTFVESGTFTLSQAATVRLLVVGGGGGGGRDCAGAVARAVRARARRTPTAGRPSSTSPRTPAIPRPASGRTSPPKPRR